MRAPVWSRGFELDGAEEDDEDRAEDVDRGQKGAEQPGGPQPRAAGAVGPGFPQDEVLAVETGVDERQRGERDAADEEGPEGERQALPQAAHLEDIVLLAEALDDDAGREEQQRLEEGVRHEVEDGGRPGAHPERQEHVADLADGRVGENALDIGLIERTEAGQQQRQRADDRDGSVDRRRQVVEDMRAGDEIDTGRHHGRGMDERADRRRARHGVGQPGLQRQLRRLTDRAAEQQRRRGDRQPRSRPANARRPAASGAGSRACPNG